MADVSKIKLPNNTEVSIKDARISGIDSTPTSGSTNVVTSGGVYSSLDNYLPLSGGMMDEGAYIGVSESDGDYSTTISSASLEIDNEVDNYTVVVDGEYPGFTAMAGIGNANAKTTTFHPEGIAHKPSSTSPYYLLSFPSKTGTIAVTSDIPSVDSSPTSGSSNAVSSGGVYTAINNIPSLPSVTSSDNGKVMQVVSGAWAAGTAPYVPLTGGTMTGPLVITPSTSSVQTSDGVDFGSVGHIAAATGGSVGIYATNTIYLRPGNGSFSTSYGIDIGTGTVTFKAPNVVITAGTSGTPTIELRRGTATDAYVDWKIISSAGQLIFSYGASGTDTAKVLIASASFRPHADTVTNNISSMTLGTSDAQWGTVYAEDVTASGDIAATGTVTGSNIPTYHTGTSDPSSSLGSDGDIYLKISS